MMAMRLALEVGEPDVDGLLDRLTWRQLMEWCAFYRIDPWGSQRQDANFAYLMTMIASGFGDKNAQLSRFMLFPGKTATTKKRSFDSFMAFMGRK